MYSTRLKVCQSPTPPVTGWRAPSPDPAACCVCADRSDGSWFEDAGVKQPCVHCLQLLPTAPTIETAAPLVAHDVSCHTYRTSIPNSTRWTSSQALDSAIPWAPVDIPEAQGQITTAARWDACHNLVGLVPGCECGGPCDENSAVIGDSLSPRAKTRLMSIAHPRKGGPTSARSDVPTHRLV